MQHINDHIIKLLVDCSPHTAIILPTIHLFLSLLPFMARCQLIAELAAINSHTPSMIISDKSVWNSAQQRHPSQTASEVTILRLDQNLYDHADHDVDTLIQTKYNEEERKHIIVNRTGGKIIDSRTISNIEEYTLQTSCKPLVMVEKKYPHNPFQDSQMDFIIERLDSSRGPSDSRIEQIYKNPIKTSEWEKEKGSILKSLWSDNWKELDRLHQQFLQTIVKNHPESFTNFLDRKNSNSVVDVNYRYQSNWTALHYAAMHGSIQIFSRLVNHPRIDINALTDFGQTPLHIASKANKLENCLLLLSAGVCFDQRDEDLYTALHYAAQLGYKDIAEALIAHGASYQIKNSNGMTAVDLASNNASFTTVFGHINEQKKPAEIDLLYRNRTNHRAMVEKMLHMSVGSGPQPVSQTKKVVSKQKEKLSSRKQNIFKMYQFIKDQHKVETITLSSFKFYKRIGQGAFGEVYLAKKEGKDRFFALKAIRKQRVFGTSLYRYIQTQKEILSLLNHPFIVKLRYAFQTETYLFLAMDFCEGGDLSKLLEKRKKFEEKYVRNYACEILLGIEALHKNKILYRDLKPENIVLDKDGHALITDFGLSKKSDDLDEINKSFCGTPAYLPLQIINKKGHNRMADWYEFGVVIYELYTGFPPFYADTKAELYDLVRAGVIRFPKNTPEVFRDLIKKLLSQNPQKRLGKEKDAESIKQHPWFNEVDWQAVLQRKLQMPPIDNKLKIGEPIKTKFHDVKSEKFQMPMWSFIS